MSPELLEEDYRSTREDVDMLIARGNFLRKEELRIQQDVKVQLSVGRNRKRRVAYIIQGY